MQSSHINQRRTAVRGPDRFEGDSSHPQLYRRSLIYMDPDFPRPKLQHLTFLILLIILLYFLGV